MSGSPRQAYSHDLLPPVAVAAEGTHTPVGRQALHCRLDQHFEAVPAVARLAVRKHGHASSDVSVLVVLVPPVRAARGSSSGGGVLWASSRIGCSSTASAPPEQDEPDDLLSIRTKRVGRVSGVGYQAVVHPNNSSTSNEEVTPATLVSPDRWFKSNGSCKLTPCPPSRPIILKQTQPNEGPAPAGTEQGGEPWNRVFADQIYALVFKCVGKLLDGFGRVYVPRPQQPEEPPPCPFQHIHCCLLPTLSSAHSSNGSMSPRPMCRASSRHGSPSPSCS